MTKPTPPAIAPRINNQGLVEYIDIFTGQVVAISTSPEDNILNHRFDDLIKIDTPEGPVFLEKHLDPDRVLKHSRSTPRHHPPYSLAWAKIITQRLLNPREMLNPSHPHHGKPETLKEALKSLQINPSVFAEWKTKEEFGQAIDQALQEQAQYLQDEALEISRLTSDIKTLPIKQFQTDILMKQAKQANQARFGDKQKVEHSGSVAHTIVVETGIRRGKDFIPPGFEDAIRDATPKGDERKVLQPALLDGDDAVGASKKEGSSEQEAHPPGRPVGDETLCRLRSEGLSSQYAVDSSLETKTPQGEPEPKAWETKEGHEARPFLSDSWDTDHQEPQPIPDISHEPF